MPPPVAGTQPAAGRKSALGRASTRPGLMVRGRRAGARRSGGKLLRAVVSLVPAAGAHVGGGGGGGAQALPRPRRPHPLREGAPASASSGPALREACS